MRSRKQPTCLQIKKPDLINLESNTDHILEAAYGEGWMESKRASREEHSIESARQMDRPSTQNRVGL